MRLILQIAIILILFRPAVFAERYDDAPTILRETVEQSVQITLKAVQLEGVEKAYTRITDQWPLLVLYTATDALSINNPMADSLRSIRALKNKNEAARTDKNADASASAPVTTTMVEKAGLPRVLAIAVERGAVEQSTEGTDLTLTTTPYALLTLFIEDSQQNYVRYNLLNRIGVSGTFLVNENADTTRQSASNNLEEFNLMLRLLGDRSTRSRNFNAKWERNIKPLMSERIRIISGLLDKALSDEVEFWEKTDSLKLDILSYVRIYISQNKTKSEEVKIRELTDTILGYLKSGIYDPLVAGEIKLKEGNERFVKDSVALDIEQAANLLFEAGAKTKELLRELENSPLLTLGYSLQRFENRSDISEIRLIYDRPVAGRNLYANAFVSLNHDPDETLNEKTVRDFGGALSWERKLKNIITRNFSDRDISPITVSLDARLAYLKVEEEVVFSSQLRFTIPIAGGLALPASIGYSSRFVESDNSEFWAVFGLNFDVDKLIALAQMSNR